MPNRTLDDTIREPDVLAFWNRPGPGSVALWVRWVVVVACVTTIVACAVGAKTLWQIGDLRGHSFWFRNGLAIGVGITLAVAFIPRSPVSRFVRLIVLLPILHLVAIGVVWRLWAAISAHMTDFLLSNQLAGGVPIVEITLGTLAACVAVGWLVARRRRTSDDWIQGTVTMALVDLLLLGLWLPIASRVWCSKAEYDGWMDTMTVLQAPGHFIAFVLVPPLVVAAGFTAMLIRRPEVLRRQWLVGLGVTIVAFFAALVCRIQAPAGAYLLYGNLLQAVLAVAIATIAALAALALVMYLRTRRARRALANDRACRTGVIAFDDDASDIVACFEITSWLRGPRVLLRPFTVTTQLGDVPVPGGAQLVAPLPLATTQLESGESVAVLRRGDRVVLAGYVENSSDGHPFRNSNAPIAGDAIRVSPRRLHDLRANDDGYGFANIALGLWRPCIAYLVILVAVALPGLIAALVTPH